MEKEPLFSVSQYTTYPLSFEQDIRLYAALGVHGIELCEEKLSPDAGRRHEQIAMLKESGLRVTSVQPAMLSVFPHTLDLGRAPSDPAQRRVHYRRTIDLVAENFPGESVPLVAGGGIAPNQNFREAHRIAREHYRELADYAGDRGVRLMFEPLSPNHMNLFTFISNLTEALALIEDVCRPNFGLCLDVWHVWREPGMAQRLAKLPDIIHAVHLCDWPAGEPRCLADRVLPGDGLIDFPSLLAGIEATGYRGAYCLEIFSDTSLEDSLWTTDPRLVVERGRAGFLKSWNRRALR